MVARRGFIERLLLVAIIALPCTLPIMVVVDYLHKNSALPGWFAEVLVWVCFVMGYTYAMALHFSGVWEDD